MYFSWHQLCQLAFSTRTSSCLGDLDLIGRFVYMQPYGYDGSLCSWVSVYKCRVAPATRGGWLFFELRKPNRGEAGKVDT